MYYFFCILLSIFFTVNQARELHYISLGNAKYATDFTHFEYTNPNAPPGGNLTQIAYGSFDNVNPFILSGIAASGLGNTFDSLAIRSLDEPHSVYGLIAETFDIDYSQNKMTVKIRKNAFFSDGTPVLARDIITTWQTLKTHGHPYYQQYYRQVAKIQEVNDYTVIYFLQAHNPNTEIYLNLAQMPILSANDLRDRDFSKTQTKPLIGSGPYKVQQYHLGKDITYERNPNYWGKHLAVNCGRHNVDSIKILYYRDSVVALTAFKNHEHDIHFENVAKLWATGYRGKALKKGKIIKENIPDHSPQSMQAFAMNLNNPLFKDRLVRKALNYAFNFSWLNSNLFYDSYTRTESYFTNSPYQANQLPSKEELAILEPYKEDLPKDIFDNIFQLPKGDASGNNRDNLILAKKWLEESGWIIEGFHRVHQKTKKRFEFTLLIQSPSMKRICLPFKESLARLGITMHIQMVSPSTWIRKIKDHDYDMTTYVWPLSNFPGAEQMLYWHSKYAGKYGSDNILNLQNPIVDNLVTQLTKAQDNETLIRYARVLDRVLLEGYYVIAHWYLPYWRIAYWQDIHHPKKHPLYGVDLASWWIEEAR
ncbi:MAG: extracellular solute-binding protein [Pseudomonadota bacterium]|nr:extracellular solute-binding protein [Pseudomonadota bacterium]